ncbi:unnamed protein product, partial [Amaranthus hypochondriacus]
MDIGTTLSVVQTLLAALQCSQLKDFFSKKSVSSQLDQLEATVKRIKAVLLDAEDKLVLSKHEQVYIEELKEVLYEADDLFDELLTLAQQNKLNDGVKDRLLSFCNKLKVDYRISQKVEEIKLKLDGIASRNELVSFKHDPQPLKMRSRETCSYVHTVDIIGRDDDLKKIVDLLLQSHGKESVSFLSIVGIGGLGKTALAQLVFNDPRVASAFPMKLWTCVSDEDQQDFDDTAILSKILEAATKNKHHDDTKDRIQRQLHQELEGKKYLLVLDDVWTENREQWCKLEQFLIRSQRESWVLVTTRSKRTAGIVGNGSVHELKGLSQDNSWCLFERVAFGPVLTNPPQELVSIGKKIVEKCANVPLAIRVAGSLLYGQDKRKWLSFQELPLTKFEDSKSGIMPILKLSYHQLESPLKSCFGYCALFPKDYVLNKATLMALWMAQGYIPSNDERSMEDVAEEYFLVLLRRCFFQDVEEDIYGEIESCKIHDLMHDVAQELVGKEICRVDAIADIVGKNVRHISTIKKWKSYTFNKTRIRSYLQLQSKFFEEGHLYGLSVNALLDNWKYLRVLNLSNIGLNSLSNSIGKLIHLRYLDLSPNHKLEVLPKHFTKLYNLEFLNLGWCISLKELPKDINKLVKLRALRLDCCYGLSYMPRSITKLSCLKVLSMFVVGETNCSPEKLSNALEDLKLLRKLEGDLYIMIGYC